MVVSGEREGKTWVFEDSKIQLSTSTRKRRKNKQKE